MKKSTIILFVFFLIGISKSASATWTIDFSMTDGPSSIQLSWVIDYAWYNFATLENGKLEKRDVTINSEWEMYSMLVLDKHHYPAASQNFTDNNVIAGHEYEYKVIYIWQGDVHEDVEHFGRIRHSVPSVPIYDPNSWQLIYQEDFSGTSLDPSKWYVTNNYDFWGNPDKEDHHRPYVNTNRPQNFEVSNGTMKITARQEDYTCPSNDAYYCGYKGSSEPYHYTTALIETDCEKYKYVYAEALIKVPFNTAGGRGLWPSFWTFRAENRVPGPNDAGEIDIFEMDQVPNNPGDQWLPTNVHLAYGDNAPEWQQTVNIGPHTGNIWVKYGIMWDENVISWYVNDVLYREISNPGVNDAERFIFNIAIRENPDNYIFPATMEVDYFKVYGKKVSMNNYTVQVGEIKNQYSSYSIDVAGNANNYIVDANTSAHGTLDLYAENKIKLNPGFHAKLGSSFHAEINDGSESYCNHANGSNSYKKDDDNSVAKENKSDKKISETVYGIFPNPSNGSFQINTSPDQIGSSIKINDVTGRLIYSGLLNDISQKLELDFLPSGIYIINLQKADQVYTQKLMIK